MSQQKPFMDPSIPIFGTGVLLVTGMVLGGTGAVPIAWFWGATGVLWIGFFLINLHRRVEAVPKGEKIREGLRTLGSALQFALYFVLLCCAACLLMVLRATACVK